MFYNIGHRSLLLNPIVRENRFLPFFLPPEMKKNGLKRRRQNPRLPRRHRQPLPRSEVIKLFTDVTYNWAK